MNHPNVLDPQVSDKLVERINQLNSETQPTWGKMSVDQMLAHCCVAYEMMFEPERFKKANGFMKFILKRLVKSTVCGPGTYKKNSRTAPEFKVDSKKDFEKERERLVGYIRKVQDAGPSFFEGKESLSFGVLSQDEWNSLQYKHLDHHLQQFGV